VGGPESAQPATGKRAAGGEALVLLAGSASAAERALVARWLRDGHLSRSVLLPLDGPDLARSLDRAVPETVVTAVRVAWLPCERRGERRVPRSDVLSQGNPRRPPAFWQNRIIRREPDRAPMVVAEPPTVAALRAPGGGHRPLPPFLFLPGALPPTIPPPSTPGAVCTASYWSRSPRSPGGLTLASTAIIA